MERLDELIQRYCPNGVEYVRLGDVVSISRGASPRPIQNYLTTDDSGIPWIKIGDVSIASKYISSTSERITKEGASKSRFLRKGAFVLSNSMSFGRPYILGIDGCIHDGWISICDFEAALNSDFLYYLLRSDVVQGYWTSKANSGGAVANLNSDIVRSTPIPLPPLPVQEEIVRILDIFTNLAAELQAELQARQQQYQYYRDTLLSFDGRDDVQWKKLGEVADLLSGFPFDSSQFTDRGIRLMRGVNIKRGQLCFNDTDDRYWVSTKGLEKYIVKENDIVISMDGSLVGRSFGMVKKEYLPLLLVQRVARIRSSIVNINYIYHCINNWFPNYVDKKKTQGAIPHISMKDIANFPIPVPSSKEQERVATILDRFDTLTNDLSQGLPAEIEARRQQYEYYRNRLLTFQRK